MIILLLQIVMFNPRFLFLVQFYKGFMKALKIVVISLLSVFVVIYLAFLFVLPYSIDLNKYSPQITQLIQDSTGLKVDIEGLKVKTAWNLSAGALIDKTSLEYPTGEKFAQINGLQIRLSLLPIFWGKFQIDKIDAQKVLANLDVDNKSEFLLNKYLGKSSTTKMPFKSLTPSDNMPDISAKKYRISLIQGTKNYTVKGENLKISDFILNKKIKVKTNGDLILNDRKQISYNVTIFSKILPKSEGSKPAKADFIKILDDLYKYSVKSNINMNIKMAPKDDNVDIQGKMNLNNITFTLGNNIYPPGNLLLNCKGDKININSDFYTDTNSKAVITGFFTNGKHRAIDLQVKSDRANLKNTIFMANTILKTFGIKKLEGVNADGWAQANFNVKSDFKKVRSNGYLKIKNASFTNKSYNVAMNSVNADVDFSQDSVKIKQATAKLNSQPISIKGTIDKNANADISVLADNLQLKGLLLALGKEKILKENDIFGVVNVRAALRGQLDKTSPQISAIANNINLKNKETRTLVKIAKITVNPSLDKKNKGRAEITELKVHPNAPAEISVPKAVLTFDDNQANIEKTYLYLNNIKTNLSGKISNLKSTPQLNQLTISIPNQISVPIAGFSGSSAILKGTLTLNGDLNNPQIAGGINIPLISIPTISTSLKNTSMNFKDFTLNCEQIQIANSYGKFSAKINKDFSKGIVAHDMDFLATNLDLNGIVPVFKNMPKNNGSNITILNGKSRIEKFRTANISLSNAESNLELKNNILHMTNLRGDAYYGKVVGNIDYDFTHRKTILNLQGRGLSANSALAGMTNRNDDIYGQLDFDTNLSMSGSEKNELLRSLNGNVKLIISNGRMGALGKFEHLLYAQNVVSNSVFRATLNGIAKAVTMKNTGGFKYMKCKLKFNDGWAYISSIKTSGPLMSLYATGRYNIQYNSASLTVLGRISDDVVRTLGPIGEFSMDKAVSSIPRIGEITAFFANQYRTNPYYENTSQIPYLTPKTEFPTKEFKVVIDGEIDKQSSVKSFKWLAQPISKQSSPQTRPQTPPSQAVPDFVKNLPDLKH